MLLLTTWEKLAGIVSIRYFVIAGMVWLIWYRMLKRKIGFRKIQLRYPQGRDYYREISFSLCTILIFSLVPYLVLYTPFVKYTRFYTDSSRYSQLYFWLAFPLIFLIHDTYFYWTHRLMHHRILFRYFHLVHHRSVNPSPWAALSFHPLEAVVESGVLVVLVLLIPLNRWHLFAFFLVMMLYNVYGHLGWELYPKKFSSSRIGKWINTSVNHNLHHQYFSGNYGLYFLWWDRWMHTIRPDYDEKFREVKNRQPAKNFQ